MTLTLNTRVRVIAGLDMISGVTGTVTGMQDRDGTAVYHVRMDRSWAELGSVNPAFQGHTLWAESSALEVLDDLRDCNDCGAKPGEEHGGGCDVARCIATGRQQIQCQPGARMVVRGILPNGGVDVDWVTDGHDCGRDVWSGRWPDNDVPEDFG